MIDSNPDCIYSRLRVTFNSGTEYLPVKCARPVQVAISAHKRTSGTGVPQALDITLRDTLRPLRVESLSF